MKLKYANQLTEDELKDLLLRFAQVQHGAVELDDYFRCKHLTYSVYLEAVYNASPIKEMQYFCPVELLLDDYHVYEGYNGNFKVVQSFEEAYQKYMRSKFGEQYVIDWVKNHIDGVKSY